MPPPPPPAAGPAAGLEQFARQHRTQLLAGGAAAVALFAYWRRRSSGQAANTADPQLDPNAAQAAAVAGYASTGGGGLYSSGVTDFYDAIQPTLEQLQSQLDKLAAKQAVPGVPVTPTPVVTPATITTRTAPILRAAAPSPVVTPARTYQVQAGDSLSKIAGTLGLAGGTSTGWQALYAANKGLIGGNPNLIRPGQTLTIPA